MRFLLYPFSFLYGLVVRVRNLFYDKGIFKSEEFKKPYTIGVGNLSAGGTGKSPHVAFLANELSKRYHTAILSRGYKRRTTGFIIARDKDSSETIGDEPAMYYSRFQNKVKVAVCEDRVSGIRQIIQKHPETEVVVLDDVFQHRKIKPSLNILITSYRYPFYKDHLLPTGYLREPVSGKSRANIIIVSKCPSNISSEEKQRIRNKINPDSNQQLYFSSYIYSELIPVFGNKEKLTKANVVLITGIADPVPLKNHLKEKYNLVKTFEFSDHHEFSLKDIERVVDNFNNIAAPDKVLVTTEKDLTRLNNQAIKEKLISLPLFVVRIDVEINESDKIEIFNKIEQGIHG